MDHVAILRKANIKKDDDLLGDILSGRKTIESRWYANKIAPWDKIRAGDTVYLKESGRAVTAKAEVSKVLQYDNLNTEIKKGIVRKYGKQIAPSTSEDDFLAWLGKQKNKRYCILIFLANVTPVKPFEIDKTGYGNSSAWLVTDNIKKLRK